MKSNVDNQTAQYKDIDRKGKKSTVKDIGESIQRRAAKITSYWKKGNKKNSLYIAANVSPPLSSGGLLYEYLWAPQVVLVSVRPSGGSSRVLRKAGQVPLQTVNFRGF
jgi:hypothetical protein